MAKPAPNKLMNNPFFANRHQPVINANQPAAAKPPGQLKSKWQPTSVPKKEETVNSKQSLTTPKSQTITPAETPGTQKYPETPSPNPAAPTILEKPLEPPTPVEAPVKTPVEQPSSKHIELSKPQPKQEPLRQPIEQQPKPKIIGQSIYQPMQQQPVSESTMASQPDHSLGNEFRLSTPSKAKTSHTEDSERRKSFASFGSMDSPLPWKSFEVADRRRNSLAPPFNVTDKLDDMILQLLVSQAVMDAKDFEVLTMEEVESLKEKHISLTNRIEDQTAKLALESKMREASQSLARLQSTNKKMAQQSQDHLIASTQKVDSVAKELWRLTQLGTETQQRLLQHTAGTLSVGVKVLEDELSRRSQKDSSSVKRYSHPPKDIEAEEKVAKLTSDLRKRDQEIKIQHAEIEQLRSDKLHDMEFESNNNVQAKEREIRELRTELEQLHNGLDFLVRRHQISDHGVRMQPSDAMTTSSSSEDLSSWDDARAGTDFGFKSVHTSTTSIADIRADDFSSTTVPTHTTTLDTLDKLLKDAQGKARKIEAEAEDTRIALEQSQQKILRHQEDSQRYQKLEKEIDNLKSQNTKLQRDVRTLEADNTKLRQDAESTHKNHNSVLEKEVVHARQQLEKLEADLYGLTELFPMEKSHGNSSELSPLELAAVKIREIVSENIRIEESMSSMEAAIKEHEEDREKITAELQAVKMQLQSRPPRTNSPTASMDTRAMEARERALQRELQQFKSEVFELRTQREDWERNVDTKSASESQHEAITNQMEELNVKHQHEVEMLQSQLDFIGQENERLKRETESFEKQFTHNKKTLDNMKNEIDVKENSISTLKMDILKVQEQLEQKIKSEESLFAAEQQMHKNHDAQIDLLKQEVESLEAKMRQNASQFEELMSSKNQRLTAANEQIERLQQDIVNLRNQVAQHSDKRGDSEEVRQLKTEIDGLHRNREMIQSELAITQKQLRETQDDLLTAQSQFTVRESALLLQSSSIEADFEAIFKEYERLTRNITDFASERQAYDERIQELLQYKNQIQTELADEKVRCLQMGSESNSTQTLRKEFRRLMSDVKAEHVRELEKAEEERRKLETTLRNIRREEEKRRWEKQSTGVQTNFVFDSVSM